ncbi:hypothetical protein ALTERO38_52093 [Alteromonas sp. 38]|nr:hypothetical protein ALTER154_50133 [Alteromonas sp. 154]VXB98677.1 hypothetical protein ALTERO38_52093 [Alteromonas sp. 38]
MDSHTNPPQVQYINIHVNGTIVTLIKITEFTLCLALENRSSAYKIPLTTIVFRGACAERSCVVKTITAERATSIAVSGLKLG